MVVGGTVNNEATDVLLFGFDDPCFCGCWRSDDNDTLVGLTLTGLLLVSGHDAVLILPVVLEVVVIGVVLDVVLLLGSGWVLLPVVI
jgi:hypothetical protein